MHGLYIEGARFDMQAGQLKRSHPKVLVEELAILAVVPIEAHRLKLQVCIYSAAGSRPGLDAVCKRQVLMSSCILYSVYTYAFGWRSVKRELGVAGVLALADICLNAVY